MELIDLILNIVVNNMDVFMVYLLLCGYLDKKAKMGFKMGLLLVAWGCIMGISSNYLGAEIYKLTFYLSVILFIKLRTRKKTHDVLILFSLIIVVVVMVQLLISLTIFLIPLNESIIFLIGETITLFFIFLICKKLPIYKVFHEVEKGLFLNFFFFLLLVIYFAIQCLQNFRFQYIEPTVLYYFIFVVASMIGFFQTSYKIFYYTKTFPKMHHEIRNILSGICLTIHITDDIAEIRREVGYYCDIYGIHIQFNDGEVLNESDAIHTFLESKRAERSKKLEFDVTLHYLENNCMISLPVIIQMLGTLLDNAMDASKSGGKVRIYTLVDENNVIIETSNEYVRKSKDGLDMMFLEGYTTKGQNGRGYGLSNLNAMVKDYGGLVTVHQGYREGFHREAITFTIKIHNYIGMKVKNQSNT